MLKRWVLRQMEFGCELSLCGHGFPILRPFSRNKSPRLLGPTLDLHFLRSWKFGCLGNKCDCWAHSPRWAADSQHGNLAPGIAKLELVLANRLFHSKVFETWYDIICNCTFLQSESAPKGLEKFEILHLYARMGSKNFSTVKCEEVAVYADTSSARDNEARLMIA